MRHNGPEWPQRRKAYPLGGGISQLGDLLLDLALVALSLGLLGSLVALATIGLGIGAGGHVTSG